MEKSRDYIIESLAGYGKLEELKAIFEKSYTQLEIDVALENAVAYSQMKVIDYLLTLGANFSNYDFQGVYYAVHNDEIEGLKYSILKGVDINVNQGMIINTSIFTAINTKKEEMVKWILENGGNPKFLTKDSLELVRKYGSSELKKIINEKK